MGQEMVELRVCAYLSRHNSDQDRLDDSAWQELCERVEMIAREGRYEELAVELIR